MDKQRVQTMADALPLSREVRIKVYRSLFSGERLEYVNHLAKSPQDRASCVSILFVSRKCLVEARPVLLDTVQVNVTELFDVHYATINSLVLKPEMCRFVFLLASELIHLYEISGPVEGDDFAAVEKCITKMKNFKSLTFGSDLDYGFDDEDPQGGWINAQAVSYIKNHPNRMWELDRDAGLRPWLETELCTLEPMVKA